MHFEDLLYYTKEEGRTEGKDINIIASELETDVDSIKNIYDAVANAGPDYNIDAIVSAVLNQTT